MKNPMTPAGIEPSTFRFVTQHLNHYECRINKWKYERIPGTDDGRSNQPEKVKYLNCSGISITNGSEYTREITSTRVHGKGNIQQEEGAFRQHIGLKFREGTCKLTHLEPPCVVLKLGHIGE